MSSFGKDRSIWVSKVPTQTLCCVSCYELHVSARAVAEESWGQPMPYQQP